MRGIEVMPEATGDLTINAAAMECVRRFIQAEHRQDLIRYRILLHDDVIVRVGDDIVAKGADDVATLAAREWAAAPDARKTVNELGVASGLITVRYQVADGVIPGRTMQPQSLDGYSTYEVQDDKILRVWHQLTVNELR